MAAKPGSGQDPARIPVVNAAVAHVEFQLDMINVLVVTCLRTFRKLMELELICTLCTFELVSVYPVCNIYMVPVNCTVRARTPETFIYTLTRTLF